MKKQNKIKSTSNTDQHMQWWRDAKYGMFIHWGLYALPGRSEWALNFEGLPQEEYSKLAQEFNPRYFNASSWAKTAREAGMKYMVLTAKHHDGFCMWDSKTTDYSSAQTAAGRDFVAEYVAACRAEGLKVGIYFSLVDWNHADGDMRGIDDLEARKRFVEYSMAQVRELCTRYGKIDILWYDGCFFKLREQYFWRDSGLNEMVRKLQPGIIINNRSDTPEDFGTPEEHIKPDPSGRDWEACMTLNGSWGFYRGANEWKTATDIIGMLGTCAQSGGNLLLNVGPDADGLIPAECVRNLREVGSWLQRNGEALYGTRAGTVGRGYYFGMMTVRGNNLYVWTRFWTGREFRLSRLHCRVKKATLLNGGFDLDFEQHDHRLLLKNLPENPPDTPYTVIKLEIDGEPKHLSGPSLSPDSSWKEYEK